MIGIVDYGLGNIAAFVNVYKRLNMPFVVAKEAALLESATKIILPGVGHFDHAMKLLESSGMRGPLEKCVLEDRVPVLGVCVGMQIMGRGSEEGACSGLGWIDADVVNFRSGNSLGDIALPHMGWNDVEPISNSRLFRSLDEARFYFLHSYYVRCDDDSVVSARSF